MEYLSGLSSLNNEDLGAVRYLIQSSARSAMTEAEGRHNGSKLQACAIKSLNPNGKSIGMKGRTPSTAMSRNHSAGEQVLDSSSRGICWENIYQ